MEGRTVQQLPPCSSSPTGAVSTRQEARREEGDSRRRGQEAALGDRGPLSQQRRLRQATQFLHKDSADLLPLDSLKRLGTSKDLQPHSVIQRRLVEGSQSRLQGESHLVQALVRGQEGRRKTSKMEVPALLVNCKCRDQELRVAVDTGTHHNQISAGCLSRLGLGKKVLKAPGGGLAPGPPTQVEQLELQLGQETVACSAQVVDVESPEFCLGLQTLLSLKVRTMLALDPHLWPDPKGWEKEVKAVWGNGALLQPGSWGRPCLSLLLPP
uniref:Nuclear receptor interacting protein 2 n=1 Tax=Ailuropoda melanoleuca TaxID=9646 RepID=G1LDZ5_AILME